jgi:hypothetical protein
MPTASTGGCSTSVRASSPAPLTPPLSPWERG